MKLEVGMYVRTKNGYIRKIDRIWNDTDFNVEKIYYNNNIDEDTLGCVLDEDIKGNPSFNIIDIIEEGDYVNGYEVGFVDKEIKMVICYTANFEENEIDTILTKEQIKKMEYKVGE